MSEMGQESGDCVFVSLFPLSIPPSAVFPTQQCRAQMLSVSIGVISSYAFVDGGRAHS